MLKKNLLLVLAGCLLGFIPLYPKLPLFDLIPGYLVRVRIEDFLIAGTTLVWLVQLIRKKVQLHVPLTKLFALYILAGILSLISAVFWTKTIPFELLHVGKSALHLLRYLEYFMLFFILYSAIRSRQDLKILLVTIFITLLAVSAYGVGQKYLYWPVYSTMNREFSEGLRLYLTPHARVQSTFGGHYDLGGYLVITLPFVLAAIFVTKRRKVRLALYGLFFFGIWLITVSASRSSYASLILALLVVLIIFGVSQKKWSQKIWWFVKQSFVVGLGSLLILVVFGKDLYERLLQGQTLIPKISFSLPTPTIAIPKNAISTDEAATLAATVLVPSDQRPVAERPSDVYVNVPDRKLVATTSAEGVETFTLVETERIYSQNALEKGLSLAIRLDTLWPQAIAGFYRNPLLGSGYATLTKETIQQFTEAESTDNNYLRTLGETGLAGFLTFYGAVMTVLVLTLKTFFKPLKKLGALDKIVLAGFGAGTLGLLLNAAYIDVFAASKIAQMFWAYAGLAMAVVSWQRS